MGRFDFRHDARQAAPSLSRKVSVKAGARTVAPGFSRGDVGSIRMGVCFSGRQDRRPEAPVASHRRPLSPAEADFPNWGACSNPPAEAGGYGSFSGDERRLTNGGELRFANGRSVNG